MKKAILVLGYMLLMMTVYPQNQNSGSWADLMKESQSIGKPQWRPMLKYLAVLHQKSTHPPVWPFKNEWEEIGPGYVYGPAFGHIDLVHEVIDVMPSFPEHALNQLKNNLENQEAWGLVPGAIWMAGSLNAPGIQNGTGAGKDSAGWNRETQGHPPIWVIAADDYIRLIGDNKEILGFYTALIRQLAWFENNRRADGEGYFYNDILTKLWESGTDRGIRFDLPVEGKPACIDATCHVYMLYKMALKWQKELGISDPVSLKRFQVLEKFIQDDLYDKEKGMFFDRWAIKDKSLQTYAMETFIPIVVGAATREQANRLIDECLLDTANFLTVHPVPTVGKRDPKFELRMWRGPSWNCMTYWIARGCMNYGRDDAARVLLERALDDSALQFEKTGTIWEFYHPFGGDQNSLKRKPGKFDKPCRDYLGHNPFFAMTRMYENIVYNKKE